MEEKCDTKREITWRITENTASTLTVLIMYYKQISEGYEDQTHFPIMQKMEHPFPDAHSILAAPDGGWCAFLFTLNIINILLNYSVIDNRPLLNWVMLVCYLILAVIYSAVYGFISRTYYRIVNRGIVTH